jgi:hypothetical protein
MLNLMVLGKNNAEKKSVSTDADHIYSFEAPTTLLFLLQVCTTAGQGRRRRYH